MYVLWYLLWTLWHRVQALHCIIHHHLNMESYWCPITSKIGKSQTVPTMRASIQMSRTSLWCNCYSKGCCHQRKHKSWTGLCRWGCCRVSFNDWKGKYSLTSLKCSGCCRLSSCRGKEIVASACDAVVSAEKAFTVWDSAADPCDALVGAEKCQLLGMLLKEKILPHQLVM